MLVSGTITDEGGSIQSVRVSVPAAGLNETIAIAEDGSFSHSFSTQEITETILVTVAAIDWNGNEMSVTRTLFNDETGPHISITEPMDRSTYGTVVRMSGTITDLVGAAATEEVSACGYTIRGTDVSGSIDPDTEGAFTFEFATRLADGTQVIDGFATIEVTADDWNGNQTLSTVTSLRAATGDVSGFTVTPGNGQVTIEWDEVLHALSYTLLEPKYG